MKKNFLKTCIVALLLTTFSLGVQGQPPPPPPDPAGGTFNGNGPVGGGAPIAEGMTILMLLAAGYGVKRYRQSTDLEE